MSHAILQVHVSTNYMLFNCIRAHSHDDSLLWCCLLLSMYICLFLKKGKMYNVMCDETQVIRAWGTLCYNAKIFI